MGRIKETKIRSDTNTDKMSIAPQEKSENKLFVANLDPRMTEFSVLKLFSGFGKIVREQYLWHTHGQYQGQPKGCCYIEYSSHEEALYAKNALDGKIALGRPLIVKFANDKKPTEKSQARNIHLERLKTRENRINPDTEDEISRLNANRYPISTSEKILAIQHKLKLLEGEINSNKTNNTSSIKIEKNPTTLSMAPQKSLSKFTMKNNQTHRPENQYKKQQKYYNSNSSSHRYSPYKK